MNRSLLELSKCRWREFRREPSAFFWVIFMPIFWMLVFGLAFNRQSETKLKVGWVGEGTSFSQKLDSHEQLELVMLTENDLTTSEIAKLSLIIQPISIEEFIFRKDKHNPQARITELLVQNIYLSDSSAKPMQVQNVEIQNAKTRYVDFVIPGLLGLSIMTSSLFGVGMTLVSARRENLLKRYRATPMNPYLFFSSYIIGRLMILTVEFTAILSAAFLLFRFQVWTSILSLSVASILGAAAFTALAVLLGSRLRNVATMSGIINLLMLPMMMLGGVFFSTENFPRWLQGFVDWLPLKVLIDLLRNVALDNHAIWQHSWSVVYLMTFAIICIIWSLFVFRWSE